MVKGNSHLVHVFERSVFKGYETLSWGRPPEPLQRRWVQCLHLIPICPQTRSSCLQVKSTFRPGPKHVRPMLRQTSFPSECSKERRSSDCENCFLAQSLKKGRHTPAMAPSTNRRDAPFT